MKNLVKKTINLTILAALSITVFTGSHGAVSAATSSDIDLLNPYAGVNWAKDGQYLSNLHTHTTFSDGANTQVQMFQAYQNLNYDFLVFTDHDFIASPWPNFNINDGKLTTAGGVGGTTGLSSVNGWKTSNVLTFKGQEVSKTGWENHHFGSYFSDFLSDGTAPDCATLIKQCADYDANGLQVLFHPGRYAYWYYKADGTTKYDSPRYSDPSNADHTNVDSRFYNIGSNSYDVVNSAINPNIVSWYVEQYKNIKSLVGMEILNAGNQYIRDRELWDDVLTQTMPARPVWAYANDDSHGTGNDSYGSSLINRDMETFVLPQKSVTAFKSAMMNGNFYVSSRYTLSGKGYFTSGADRTKALPKITDITVDKTAGTIKITGTNYNTITWISCGNVVETGDTVNYKTTAGVTKYVRAVLTGDGGESFTQPFGIVDASVSGIISDINAIPNALKKTDSSKVAQIRAAYDALTEVQKALVTNYNYLTAAEAKLAQLAASK